MYYKTCVYRSIAHKIAHACLLYIQVQHKLANVILLPISMSSCDWLQCHILSMKIITYAYKWYKVLKSFRKPYSLDPLAHRVVLQMFSSRFAPPQYSAGSSTPGQGTQTLHKLPSCLYRYPSQVMLWNYWGMTLSQKRCRDTCVVFACSVFF